MTQNQKIAIGIGVVALGYWLYTKNKASKSAGTQLSKETIDCLRNKMLVANGKITEEQFNSLVANNFSESSVSSLVESLSKVANPKADIQKLKNSAMADVYSLIKNCKDSQSNTTPSVLQNTGDTPCPQGKVSIQMNCIKAPCPSMCVDKPANATTHQKPYMPIESGEIYTCKDGSVERRLDSDYIKFGKMAPPCNNKGGIVNKRRF